MTRGNPNPEGKILIIGGGIANFTNVAATFKGIIRALKQYQQGLQSHKVRIFVRRGGPNYQEGLKAMRLLGETLGVEIQVFGPDAYITECVPLALGISKASAASNSLNVPGANGVSHANETPMPSRPSSPQPRATSQSSKANGVSSSKEKASEKQLPEDPRENQSVVSFEAGKPRERPAFRPFDEYTRALVYGLQPRAIQGMLDFDFACGRETPSVAAMIYPFGGHHVQKCLSLVLRMKWLCSHILLKKCPCMISLLGN